MTEGTCPRCQKNLVSAEEVVCQECMGAEIEWLSYKHNVLNPAIAAYEAQPNCDQMRMNSWEEEPMALKCEYKQDHEGPCSFDTYKFRSEVAERTRGPIINVCQDTNCPVKGTYHAHFPVVKDGEIHPEGAKMPGARRTLLNIASDLKHEGRTEEGEALHRVLSSEASWKMEAWRRGKANK